MNHNFKSVVRKLDTASLEERVAKREALAVAKQEQQIAADGAEAYRRGLRSYLAETRREINVKRLQADPLLAFFILANRDPSSA